MFQNETKDTSPLCFRGVYRKNHAKTRTATACKIKNLIEIIIKIIIIFIIIIIIIIGGRNGPDKSLCYRIGHSR